MAHRVTTIDALGPGVFRKLRQELRVTAFGVNAIVLPPGTEWFNHFHHRQDELYFVHAGTAGFDVDGESFEAGPVGAVYEDIFDGLAITHHTGFAFHNYADRPHYVEAAKVGEIGDSGRVTLTITCDECRHLPVHDPPESAQISPERASFVDRAREE